MEFKESLREAYGKDGALHRPRMLNDHHVVVLSSCGPVGAWQNRRQEIEQEGEPALEAIERGGALGEAQGLDLETVETAGFFDTASDYADQSLIIRAKNITDDAIPSGNAVAAAVLLNLAILEGPSTSSGRAETYYGRVVETLRLLGGAMARYPRAFGQALSALDVYLATTKEIVIIGDPQEAATQALLETVHSRYLPNKVLVVARPDQVDALSQRVPLLAGRTQVDGAATAYV